MYKKLRYLKIWILNGSHIQSYPTALIIRKPIKTGPKYYSKFRFWCRTKGREEGRMEGNKVGRWQK